MALIINRNLLHYGQGLKYEQRDVMCFYEAVKHIKWIFHMKSTCTLFLTGKSKSYSKKER